MASSSAAPPSTGSRAFVGERLRTGHLLVFLLVTHTPLTLLWGAVPEVYRAGQVEATPLVFAFAGVVLLGFVFGYSGMAKRLRHPGGVYVQVAHGLGRPVAIGAAAVILVAYIGLVAALYAFFAGVLNGLAVSLFDVEVPLGIGIAICVVAGALLSRLRARQVFPIFALILLIQMVTVVVTMVGAFGSPAGGVTSYQGLEPGGLLSGTFGVALVFALMASSGTETAANYTAELADPARSLPRATYLSYLTTTAVTVTGALAVSTLVGPANATGIAQQAGPALFPVLVAQVVGPAHAVAVTNVLMGVLLTGVFGATAGLQGALVRQLAGLARDGVLPPSLIRPNAKGKRPWVLHIAHPLVGGLVALIASSSAGALKPWVLIGCTLGLFAMLTLASLSAAAWFLRGEADEAGFFGWEGQVVAAAFSAITLALIVLYGLTHVHELDTASTDGATWLVLALITVPFVVGVVAALILRETRPEVYARIGRSGPAEGAAPDSPAEVAPVPGPSSTPSAQYAPPAHYPPTQYQPVEYGAGAPVESPGRFDRFEWSQGGEWSRSAGPPDRWAARPQAWSGATPAHGAAEPDRWGADQRGRSGAAEPPPVPQPSVPQPPYSTIPRQRSGPDVDPHRWWEAPEPDGDRPSVGSRSLDQRRWNAPPDPDRGAPR